VAVIFDVVLSKNLPKIKTVLYLFSNFDLAKRFNFNLKSLRRLPLQLG